METASETKGMASFAEAYRRLLSERPGILGSESAGELSWLKKARERDAGRWLVEGFPTRRQERWRYTNLTPIAASHVVLPRASHAPSRAAYPALKGRFAAEIVFFNGRMVPEWSRF